MEKYKQDLVDLLLKTNVLKVGGDFILKSKRTASYFLNFGDVNDGLSISKLGEAYASVILSNLMVGKDCDIIFGPAYKGIPLALTTIIALVNRGVNVGYAFDRKEAKDHGEVTSKADLQKAMLIGKKIVDGSKIIILDDVITTGATKNDALELLNNVASNLQYPALIVAVDRQEVGISGRSAVEEFTEKNGIPVFSILNISEIYQHLKTNPELNQKDVERIANYLRVYGTKEARNTLSKLEQRVIELDRSVIPACDVETIEEFEELVKQTADVKKIGGYKIGLELGLGYGLPMVVEVAKKYTNKPIIYDHQKAGTDIPDTGKNFARVCKKAGVDAVILFPESGPETEKAYIYRAFDAGLKVLIGGEMTHLGYKTSEYGFILDSRLDEMYLIGARAGVTNFVVPGNKIDRIVHYKEIIEAEGIFPIFYAPGFVVQGGKIEDATRVAGDRWHAIVGRGIYEAKDIKAAALEHTSQL